MVWRHGLGLWDNGLGPWFVTSVLDLVAKRFYGSGKPDLGVVFIMFWELEGGRFWPLL